MKLKSVLSTSAAAVALLAAGSANASGYYIGLFGGISTWEDDFNPVLGTTYAGGGTFWLNFGSFYDTTSNTYHSPTGNGPKYSANTYVGYTLPTKNGTYVSKSATGTWGPYTGAFGLGIVYASYTGSSISWQEGADDGWVIGASLGWDFGTGFRSELEIAYRSNDIEGGASQSWSYGTSYYLAFAYGIITAQSNVFGFYYYGQIFPTSKAVSVAVGTTTGYQTSPVAPATYTNTGQFNISTDGELETWSLMANLWYDFNLGDSPITPFIGGGIGIAQVGLEYTAQVYAPFAISTGVPFLTSTTTASSLYANYNVDDDDYAFAYQLGAGLGFNFGNGMMLSAQYRYFATGEVQLGAMDQFSGNVEAHNFLVGLNIPLGGGM